MAAWVIDEPGTKLKQPSILLTHGSAGDKDSKGLIALSKALTDKGHRVARVDLPYRTAGRAAPPKAEASVEGFTQLFNKVSEGKGKWVVGGKSYGGRVASLAVAQGLPAAGLLLLSYPLHAPGRPDKLRAEHWPSIRVPCMIIQGSSDPFCTLELMEENLPTLGGRYVFELVRGGDHSLKVSGKASATGKPSTEAQTLTDLGQAICDWLSQLGRTA
ncbi:MAG: alpha/beta family hydrolase [Actinomycetota bacterium]|nr:hypothetical protein [Actinomycetota bacterium]